MPLYEYACDRCQIVYQTRHGIDAPRPQRCNDCGADLRKVISAPSLNLRNFGGPTEAKYANVSAGEEIAKERELQRVYRTIWLPEEVKHSPWDDG